MQNNTKQKIVAMFLDLDDTLYPHSSGIRTCMYDNIATYMEKNFGIENGKEKMQQVMSTGKFNTTMDALLAEGYEYKNPLEYYQFVNSGFDLHDKIVANDTQLLNMLVQMKQYHEKQNIPFVLHLFSNANSEHVDRVLSHLGIAHVFDHFTTYEQMVFQSKPHPDAYWIALERAGLRDAFERGEVDAYFVDDSVKNLQAAQDMGWNVVHVNENHKWDTPQGILKISHFYELPTVLPHLFDQNE